MFLLIGLALLLALGYTQLPKTAPGGCSGYPAKLTNVGDDKTQCISSPANPPIPLFSPSKPVMPKGGTPTQSPAQSSSEPLADLPLYDKNAAPPVSIFSADRSVNGMAMNPNFVDGLPFNPVTGRAAGNTLAPQPVMYSAPTELESPAGADLSSTVDYSD